MSHRAVGLRTGVLLFSCGCLAVLPAADTSVVDYPFLGVTHIFRTGSTPNFPRNVKIHIVKIDLTTPSLSFKLTPPGGTRDVSRLTTLDFLTQQGAQIAINLHFFLPFPSTDLNADLIGFGAANGVVFSPFELPSQNYAIERDAPAINIDTNNKASIVTRAQGFSDGTCFLCVTNDGLHVQEPVILGNAFAGSAQIITNGVKTIPCYVDSTHADCKLVGPGPANYSNSNSWYSLTNARVSLGLSQDNKTLFLFTVDNANGSNGMSVPEVADLLLNDHGVYNALNMDGGGSTTLAMENPATHVRALVNASSDSAGRRIVATSLAVFAAPNPTATVSRVANAAGGVPTIAPNTWVEIKGSNLSPSGSSRIWRPSDFLNNQLPSQLDGVSVTVNGKAAYVYYISPTQVNVLTPPDALSGSVPVQVSVNGVAGNAFSAQAQTASPSLFLFDASPYVAATHSNGTLLGPTTLFPGSSTPAKPGETVVLYANGFGSTTIPVISGSIVQSGALSPLPVIRVGDTAAIVQSAGLVSPGLYQFNVTIPQNTPDGDQPVTATYGGQSTQAGALLTVQR